jgi:hypothetical protein
MTIKVGTGHASHARYEHGSIYHLGPELAGLSFTGPLLERIVAAPRDDWTFVELWEAMNGTAEVVHQRRRFTLESPTQLVDAIDQLAELGVVRAGHRVQTLHVDRTGLDGLLNGAGEE